MLSCSETRKVAKLARLALSEEELHQHRDSLAKVLAYMDRLAALNLSGVEPMAHVHGSANRLDEDVPGPTLPHEVLMQLAPDTMPPFIKVPKILGEGGGA